MHRTFVIRFLDYQNTECPMYRTLKLFRLVSYTFHRNPQIRIWQDQLLTFLLIPTTSSIYQIYQLSPILIYFKLSVIPRTIFLGTYQMKIHCIKNMNLIVKIGVETSLLALQQQLRILTTLYQCPLPLLRTSAILFETQEDHLVVVNSVVDHLEV